MIQVLILIKNNASYCWVIIPFYIMWLISYIVGNAYAHPNEINLISDTHSSHLLNANIHRNRKITLGKQA